ncbi:MAG: hypothetical protein NVS4B3_19080 [Gemmatimonadaceae bacterium]
MTPYASDSSARAGIPPGHRAGAVSPFFVLTFALTWLAWSVATALPDRGAVDAFAPSPLRGPLVFGGVVAPAIVALALSARADGRIGVDDLLRPIGRWRVGVGWYLFAAGYTVLVKLAVAPLYRLGVGAWPRFGTSPWSLMVIAVVVSTGAQAGEEIGWRGYALPRLSARLWLPAASLVLGVLWATWHLPLFLFALGSDTYGQSFLVYLLGVTALSVTMAWLYWRTGGSLLLVMLFHAAFNNTKDIVPSAGAPGSHPFFPHASVVGWLTVALLWLGSAYFLRQMRGAQLTETRA